MLEEMSDERNIWGELESIKNILGDISEAPTVISALTDIGTQLEDLKEMQRQRGILLCLSLLERTEGISGEQLTRHVKRLVKEWYDYDI